MLALKYRPEIDGLRAIAVMAVIVYHAHITLGGYRVLPGGFLGVDIFFVISGYLIGKILIGEMAVGTFTFSGFYERRARRIMPALFTVMAVSIPFAVLLLLPKAFNEYADSLIGTLFFGSNIFFWLQDSYTAVASDYKPFLHTWSLAVEEQFYLFFPPLLLGLIKYPKFTRWFFPLSLLASLGLAQYLSYDHRDASFYLLPTRIWELLAGYLIARHEVSDKCLPLRKCSVPAAYAGLLLIVVPLFFYSDGMHHPGFISLIPVAGTMLMIAYGRGNFLLSLKPAVWLGLISYSLYLWHQPVFAFARINNNGSLSTADKGFLILTSVVLAALSWWFIERPFRDRMKIDTRSLWLFVIGGTIFFSSFYAANRMFDLHARINPVSEIAARATDMTYIPDIYRDEPCRRNAGPYCVRGPMDGDRWIVLGDSHLDRVAPLLWYSLKDKNVQVTFLESGGCGYAAGMEVVMNGKVDACTAEINQARRDFLLSSSPSTVVVMARYPLYIEGTWFNNGEGGVEDIGSMMMRPKGADLPEDQRKKRIQDAITESLRELVEAGHRLVIIYPVPEAGWDVPAKANAETKDLSAEQRKAWLAQPHFSTSYDVFKARTRAAYAALDDVGVKNVNRIYPEKLFCDENRCTVHNGKFLFYSDDDHLSHDGAAMLVDEILKSTN